ncbi:MAG: LysM peptidoglycan-binding domain-containing protein [Betaproteobacteria bacterium]|nr:LysM peptidoglycan-binding domain-containing protein [Betaproteobacteria bacterium]
MHNNKIFLHLSAAVICVLLVGCAQKGRVAPVESRSVTADPELEQRSASGMRLLNPGPVPDGFYRVKRGDTLASIALEHGLDWREMAQWNQITDPNLIDVGQLLRIRDPKLRLPSKKSTPAAQAQATQPATSPSTTAKPAESGPGQAPAASSPSPAASGWRWPSNGQVVSQFSEGGRKGIAIAGAPGEAVFAAETGKVVYAGNGLRGYGNLVIVKHDNDLLSAYAHNRSILVKEGQLVKRGQQIAELGMTDADKPMLHFEIRKAGKPVDPLGYLPNR